MSYRSRWSDNGPLGDESVAGDGQAPRRGSKPATKVMIGLAAVVLAVLAGAGLLQATRDEEPAPTERAGEVASCEALGRELPPDQQCPDPSEQQRQIIAAAEAAEAAAEQAYQAADNSPGDERVEALADRAEVAAARTRRAVTDAERIVAGAPDQRPSEGALDRPLRTALLAARDAARAAAQAKALEGQAMEEEG